MEDIYVNEVEKVVVLDMFYSFTGDFDSKAEIVSKEHAISIKNERRDFEEGNYMQSYVIHNVSTLTKEQYDNEDSPLHYIAWEERVAGNNLVEFEIVNVSFTQVHSEKSNEMVPQYGDGKYSRNFIVGKNSSDKGYKIYEYGMM